MDYEEFMSVKDEYSQARKEYTHKLQRFCDELKYELKIIGRVESNCIDKIVIRSRHKLTSKQIWELNCKKRLFIDFVCEKSDGFPYTYILKGGIEEHEE